jgi:hypothetical protein
MKLFIYTLKFYLFVVYYLTTLSVSQGIYLASNDQMMWELERKYSWVKSWHLPGGLEENREEF